MEKVSIGHLSSTLFLSQPIYIHQNRGGIVVPRYIEKGNPRVEGRPRFRIGSGSKDSVAYYCSQPNFGGRSPLVVGYRSVREVRFLDSESVVRPVLILHNRPGVDRVGFLGPGNYQSGTVFTSRDDATQVVPGRSPLHRMSVHRTASAAPELQRVRQWLSDNDFTHGTGGASKNRTDVHKLPDSAAKQLENQGMMVRNSAVTMTTNHFHQMPPPPPPLPPPPPMSLSTPNLHNSGAKSQHHMGLHNIQLATNIGSPDIVSTPKLLFSSEMAAAKRTQATYQANQRKPSAAESWKVPTTPSEKHFENFVDSVFANALGSESDGRETPQSGRLFSSSDSPSQRGCRSPPPRRSNNDRVDAALLTELRDKLKKKGLASEQMESSEQRRFAVEQENIRTVTRLTGTQARLGHSDIHSDVISMDFTPLATSTPPPQPLTSPPLPPQPHSPSSMESSGTPVQSPTFSFPQTLSSTSAHPKTISFTGISRVQDMEPTNIPHKMKQHTGFLILNQDKPGSYQPQRCTESPQHSRLDWSQSSNARVEYSESPHRQPSFGGLTSSQPALEPIQTNFTLQSSQRGEDQTAGQKHGGIKYSHVTGSLSQHTIEGQAGRSDVGTGSQTNYETNTTPDAQTGQEFFNRSRSGAQFETEHNGAPGRWFDTSREIPEQRIDIPHKDLHTENIILHKGDQGDSLRYSNDTETVGTDGTLPRWDQSNVTVSENGSLLYSIKPLGSNDRSLRPIENTFENILTNRLEPRTTPVARPGCNYSQFNTGLPSGHESCNLWTSSGDGYLDEPYLAQACDLNGPDDLGLDTRSVYGRTKHVPPTSPHCVEADFLTPDGPSLPPPHGHTDYMVPQHLEDGTQLRHRHATIGDRPGTSAREEFLHSGRLRIDPQGTFTFSEDVTPFRGDSSLATSVTWLRYSDNHTCDVVDDSGPLFNSDGVVENVNFHVDNSDQVFDNLEPCVYNSYLESKTDRVVQRGPRKDVVNSVSVVRFNNTVSEFPSCYSNSGQGHESSPSETDDVHAVNCDNLSDNSDDDDTPDWTSSSSSGSDTNLQRFSSGAISQTTFNSIFAHSAKVSLRVRADRTLTGSHNNLLSAWPSEYIDEIEHNKGRGGQSRSAPSSSREKKKTARSLSIKKILGKSFFDPGRVSDASHSFECRPAGSNNIKDSPDTSDNKDPASPTTISISSSSNGSKVVRIYQANTENQRPPSDDSTTNSSTMLSNHNHDHELLPPSASKNGKNLNTNSSNSLLRSKTMFTSTPSLFNRSSPEEKFWKKEMKKEKEEKKRLEEERKKFEKQSKKEAKQRIKSEKRASTLNARNIPKEWSRMSGPVEHIYMRPGLRMRAVPIEYSDDPRSQQPPPPPISGHYAIPSAAARRGVYANGASPADMTRVEHVYGTTQRRPLSVLQQSHYATPYGYLPPREQQPRVVLLHRSPEGYGFVLRGAKSKLPTGGGFNDFTPTADYPALQYLDSVDPGSQADRAGLLAGDFILEINGENVMRSSHEHVVHLIRSSSDVLTLKVVTVTQSDPTPSDWYAFQDYGAMTLPNRKKIAAPLPPQRDPQTSLSYSKASSKSMTEGLAEIEKLDAAIAEFEGQEEARSRSHQGADDHKVASVRASHALKRVSVMDYDGLITGEPGIVAANSKGHVSPAEARIKKYHKRSASQTIERSKSTPDISAAIDQEYNEHSAGSQITGSWTKSRAPPPPPQDGHYIAKDSSPFSGVAFVGTSPYSKNTGTPDSSRRTLGNHQVTSAAPPIPEIVRIHTTGKNSNYGNVSSEIEHRKKMMESPYESSFRPENNKNVIHNADHSALSNKNNLSNQNGDKYISFADERILENAHKFVERYPNATVLVTADIHSDKIDGSKDRVLYEPDPDYEDSDDDKSVFFKTEHQNNSSIARINSKQNRDADDISNVVRQGKSSITVISINNESNRENTKKTSSSHSSPNLANSTKSSPVSIHTQENMSLTSPVQSISSSRRSSGVVMATPSQPSSAESSRRSSIQSNYSGDNVERHGRNFMPSSTSTLIMGNSRDNHQTEVPPPPPPPPPLGAAGKPSSKDANSTVKLRSNEAEAISVLQNRVSTDAILAAVADRRNRLENEGPRLSDVKPLPTSKSSHELNQEALKAAVAMRKSRLEQSEDKSVVDEIEARLNKNKKLQAAKYYGTDANRNSAVAKLEEEVHPMPVPVAAPTISRAEEKPKDVPRFEPPFKPSAQIKLSPVVPVKLNPSTNTSLSEKQTTTTGSPDPTKNIGADFRAKLKPVDVKVTGSPLVGQSKTAVSSSPNVTTPAANVTAIVMTRGNSSKAQAPPPPPPPLPPPAASTGLITTTSSVSKPKPELPALATSKPKPTPVEAKTSSTNPLSPTSPSTNSLASSSDYIALAERARQEYLKKKASGNLQANIEKRGPVEITPNRKNSQRNKPTTPTSPANAPPIPSSKSSGPTLIEVKPNMETNGDNVQISVQDRIKTLQPPEKGLTNGKTNVAGVTEDHSHTEIALSNGTIKKSSPQSKAFPPVNITSGNSSGLGARIAPPPPGFGDSDGSPNYRGGVAIDIIPPPSSFSVAGSPDSALSVPSYGQDDAASFVSSVSSLSTLSSEHGDGFHHSQMNSKDIFAHSPPPPPDFTNSTLGDQDAFIPPPPEFLEIDSNANESKAVDKNTRPFASKPVSDWSCMDVLDWLDSLNLPQYRISFAKAHVDGSKLVIMGRNEFINLGVTQVAHRMNLERSVKKLNMGASTNL